MKPLSWSGTGSGGGSKKQDVTPHFKHLSLFIDVINFLLHHLMWHVLLQMCAQKKKKPPHYRLALRVGPVWPRFLAPGSHHNCLVSLWYQVSCGLRSSRSLHQHHAIPLLSFPTRPPTEAVVGGALRAGDHVAKRWMARSAPLSPLIVKY